MTDRRTVAVIFGGQSIEHDVGVLTGIQIMDAMDSARWAPLPVYVDPQGAWWTGQALRDRRNYLLGDQTKAKLQRVRLARGAGADGGPALEPVGGGGLFGRRPAPIAFDLAIPSIHGTSGEDGSLQGAFEMAGVPYVGCRVLGAAAYMDKPFAKQIFQGLGLPTLPGKVVERPAPGRFPDFGEIAAALALDYPVCVKPANLGSSVGVARCDGSQQLGPALAQVFKLDTAALIEPFVANLVEYNVAVTRAFGEIRVSAIERPLRQSELLDFRAKYLASGDQDTKLKVPFSEGMASATRVINPPELSTEQAETIRDVARRAFLAIDGRGTARIDFLGDGATGRLWINEVNTFPGSLAYYLWERADPAVGFTELLSALIEEGFLLARWRHRATDPTLGNATVFKRG